MRERDEKLWRYLGGQPPSAQFSAQLASDPDLAKRLVELALLECTLRDERSKVEGRRILSRGLWLPAAVAGAVVLLGAATFFGITLSKQVIPAGTPILAKGAAGARSGSKSIAKGEAVRIEESTDLTFAREETRIELESGSEFSLGETSRGGKRIDLNEGRAGFAVSPQESPLEVVTPHLEIEVVGTQFDVEVGRSGSEVLVSEGTVEISSSTLTEPKAFREASGWWETAGERGVSVAMAYRASSAPSIDGVRDEVWSRHPQHSIDFVGENPRKGSESKTDHSSTWIAMWDEDALYVLIEVRDDQIGDEGTAPWFNDSGEIFLDLGYERAEKLDGEDDYLLFFDPSRGDIFPGIGSVGPSPEMKAVSVRTATGFVIEVALPWDSFGRSGIPGERIGFNVATNDADASDGERKSQLSWTPKGPGDFARPNRMGILIFSESYTP